MSVINKMLRDLDQRQAKEAVATKPYRVPYQSGSSFKVLALLLLTVLVAALGYYYLLRPASTKPQEVTTTEPVVVMANSRPVINSASSSLPANERAQPITATKRELAAKKDTVAITAPVKPDSAAANSEFKGQFNKEPTQSPSAEVAKVIEIAASLPQASAALEQATSQKVQSQPEVAVKQEVATVNSVAPVKNVINKLAVSRANTEHNLAQQALATEQAGQVKAALLLWQQLAQQQPQQADAYLAQARILQNMGLHDQAYSALILATNNGVVDSKVQLLLAQRAIEQQQWQRADKHLLPVFLLTEQPEYYGFKATVLQQLGDHRAAEQWFSKLITVQPQQAKWWLGAAISYEALGQQQQAYQHYQQALQWGQQLSAASREYIQQRLIVTE